MVAAARYISLSMVANPENELQSLFARQIQHGTGACGGTGKDWYPTVWQKHTAELFDFQSNNSNKKKKNNNNKKKNHNNNKMTINCYNKTTIL
mmetsp:Transcript_10262/g.17216  ORF Transcript_10262/g.17216 Transcript_10262/m.17216 type:complete len:93 (-) Transcript_10262:203-481(-)